MRNASLLRLCIIVSLIVLWSIVQRARQLIRKIRIRGELLLPCLRPFYSILWLLFVVAHSMVDHDDNGQMNSLSESGVIRDTRQSQRQRYMRFL